MNLNCEIFPIFEKNKDGRPAKYKGRKEIAQVEEFVEKVWDWWNYFFYRKRYHYFYTDLFSWKKFLGHYQRLCDPMV